MTKTIHKRGAQAPLLGSNAQLTIEKLAIGGSGIARHDGLVVFVPLTAPGDKIIAKFTTVKKNFAEAEVVEILEASPHRTTPPCKYFAQGCGGCNWQHLSENEQRRQKELLVHETIKKFNPGLEFEYLPLKASPRTFRYRNRIQPKAREDRFGFFSRQSHSIINIEDCLITEELLTSHFIQVRQWAAQQKAPGLKKLEMYIDAEEKVRYGLINEEDEGIGFSQVNRFQNKDLIETALNWAGDVPYVKVWDFYAGAGNFTFPLLDKYQQAQVTGVELNPKLVERARSLNQDSRLSYYVSDVESFLRKTALIGNQDLVVLDPPRAGASEYIMRSLAAARPQKIIYISCHPVSLARDLKWFFDEAHKLGHRASLEKMQAFEMFPQTDHVETIAELRVDS